MIRLYLIFILAGMMCPQLQGQSALIVQTDKPFYASGEEMGIRIFNPSASKAQIVFLDMIDRNGQVLESSIARVSGQLSFGILKLPINLSSDWYQLRAYTLWTPSMGIKDLGTVAVPVYYTFDRTAARPYEKTFAERPEKPEYEIRINLDRSQYGTRQDVHVDINLVDEAGQPLVANLAVSVLEEPIARYPATVVPGGSDIASMIDLPKEGDEPMTGLKYYGQLAESRDNVLLGMFIAEDQKITWTALNPDQSFEVDLEEFQGQKNAQLFGMEPRGDIFYLFPESREPDFGDGTMDLPIELPYTEDVVEYLESARSRLVVQDLLPDLPSAIEKEQDATIESAFEPDKTFVVDEFVRFTDTREFVEEVVSSVRVRQDANDNPAFQVLLESKRYSIQPPLMFLNGFMVSDAADLLGLPINQIAEIQVFRKNETIRKHFGSVGRNGVLIFYTHDRSQRPSNGSRLTLMGYGKHVPVIVPYRDGNSDRLPVLSPRLYWNASINTNIEGKTAFDFKSTDDQKKYTIYVRAIDAKGRQAMTTVFFEVKGINGSD